MKQQIKTLIFFVVTTPLIFLQGCASMHMDIDGNIIKENYNAADSLIKQSGDTLLKDQPVIVASFVNIDNLNSSSTFGRITAEQIASRLSQHSLKVIEMKLRDNVFIKQQSGEFILSRELKNISQEYEAQAVLCGTYAIGEYDVFISSKLIRAVDGVILSSYDYTLPKGPNMSTLIGQPQRGHVFN